MIDRIYSQYPQVIFCQNTLVYQGIPTYNCGTTDMKKKLIYGLIQGIFKKTHEIIFLTNIWSTF